MSEPFTGQVVAITGAGKGLGRAYAQHFAALGAGVVVNNRRHAADSIASADRVVAEIEKTGGSAVAEYSSVEDPKSGERLLATALERLGRIDCLVANAGIIESSSFRGQSLEGLREVLEINLLGTIHVVHPVFRHLCEQGGGSIVVSTSSAGLFGEFGLPAYSAAKAGVIGLMRSLSLEGLRKNVRVNAIAPYASTQMTAAHLSDDLNACLDPARVAPAVAWLARGTVTGEVLIAGAGRIARARMKVGYPMEVSDIGSNDWQVLEAAGTDLDFGCAGESFTNFVAGLGSSG